MPERPSRNVIPLAEINRLNAQFEEVCFSRGKIGGAPVARVQGAMSVDFVDFDEANRMVVNWDMVVGRLLENPPSFVDIAPASAFFVYIADGFHADDFYDYYDGLVESFNQKMGGSVFAVEYIDAASGSVPIVRISFVPN